MRLRYVSGPLIVTSSGALSGVIVIAGLPSTASSIVFVPGIVSTSRARAAAARARWSAPGCARRAAERRRDTSRPSSSTSRPRAPKMRGWPPRLDRRAHLLARRERRECERDRQFRALAQHPQRRGEVERNQVLDFVRARAGHDQDAVVRRAGLRRQRCASKSAPSIARLPTRSMRSRGVPHPSSCSTLRASTAKARSKSLRYAAARELIRCGAAFQPRVQPRRVQAGRRRRTARRRRSTGAPSSRPPERKFQVRSSDRRRGPAGNASRTICASNPVA